MIIPLSYHERNFDKHNYVGLADLTAYFYQPTQIAGGTACQSEAVLRFPPSTDEYLPEAMLYTPPETDDDIPTALLPPPPEIDEC